MKKKAIRVLEAIVFFALLAAAVTAASFVLERKESREKLSPFFERAQDIDVLIFGSSHVLTAVLPMELWNDYGITAYNFGGYNNTVPVSYWMLQSALEVCTPKLVVVDVDDIGHFAKVGESSSDLHTALDGLPIDKTKLSAIEDLLDDPSVYDINGNRYADLKWEYVFPMAVYHSRWAELTAQDLKPQGNELLGAQMLTGVAEPAEYGIISDSVPEEGWGFAYLRRIVEECAGRGVDVLLVNVPYPPAESDDQRYSNAVYYLAQDCGVEYIDFVYMDQIVDYATDCYDPSSHLNPSGARKVTDYLGRFMTEVYGLPDHRAEARFASWDTDYSAYADLKLRQLAEQADLKTFLMLLHDSGLSACIRVPQGSALYQDERLMRMLQNVGRRHLFEEDTYDAVWADSLFPLQELDSAAAQGEAYLAVFDRESGMIAEAVGEGETSVTASFGEVIWHEDEAGAALFIQKDGRRIECFDDASADARVQIVVIDARTGGLAMVKGFNVR